ncbi:SDR family NAD(P)-dependent oxidoreductase [Pedobacter chitinilyticus]|uniref:SDR family oxidoreductase n=1 Tax=Pedobacter chitinilyticus TaxID=2233776 RepID=A0A451GDP7_9SPHI|nr:SDR family oxidoreductase [Pedobacter chitinilyticus]RWU11016.1 SDR family oxidoreductase [Pedobacter chitinilyticus]
MILKDKNAVIYGASASIGGAFAKAFAEAGANVFVTHYRLETAQKVADEIIRNGGKAEAAAVDALDQDAIETFLKSVIDKVGSIDISFNAIGIKDVQDIPLIEMTVEDFQQPINIAMKTQFLTGTAAARYMSQQNSGVILSLTATPGGIGYANVGGFGPACNAIEGFSRNLAAEVGSSGVRVVNIRSGGSPDSRPFKEAIAAGGDEVKEFIDKMANDTMLKQMPMMADIANTGVFLASSLASKITGVTIDVTVGTTTALNYKATNVAFLKKDNKEADNL